MKEKIKGMWKSWTVWFNGAAVAIVAAFPLVQDALPQIAPLVSAALYKNVTLFVVLVNLFLRFKTTKSLADK